jgi:two-component system, chemotaxis family, protein-glutamate methylesterase/glutaminase
MSTPRTRVLQPGQKIRVLVADDSVVIRRLVCHALEEDPAIEVVGVASNGAIALNRIPQINPDVITLDIEMPEMDGLEMLRRLRREPGDIRVIMFSTLTERGAAATLDALALGADDYVTKAANGGSLDVSLTNLRLQLIPKIRQFFQFSRPQGSDVVATPQATASRSPGAAAARVMRRIEAVAIGVSTGGPAALSAIVSQFPAGFRAPIFIVQHMPPLFTRLLAERLNMLAPLAANEAVHGETAAAGRIYVAPGDFHMKVGKRQDGVGIVLDQTPPQNSCRPSVDALFASLAEVYGGGVVAAVLTGMGQDGLRGAQMLRAQGAYILAQDEASSVIWGMPGAVVHAGAAHQVVALADVVPAILKQAEGL